MFVDNILIIYYITTHIVKYIQQYEKGAVEAPSNPSSLRPQHRTLPVRTDEEKLAIMASVKLEDGDVRGKVRLLCSDDRLAIPDEFTFNELQSLHPSAPSDHRPVPSTVTPPLHVSTSTVRASIQSFPNGSSAGPDGLRPQHLKDLLTVRVMTVSCWWLSPTSRTCCLKARRRHLFKLYCSVPICLLRSDNKRPDGLTLIPWCESHLGWLSQIHRGPLSPEHIFCLRRLGS